MPSVPPSSKRHNIKTAGLVLATAALLAVLWMPAAPGLPAAGQVMLAVLAFAVIVWMTEALDYAVSAVVVGALMIFLLAAVPDAAKPASGDMGTGAALGLALSGFSNSAVALVAAACFIAAAMTATGLDRRIALLVLTKVDARTNHIVIGAMVVGFLLSFIVPSTTARVACLVPIMMGFILAFKVDNFFPVQPDRKGSARGTMLGTNPFANERAVGEVADRNSAGRQNQPWTSKPSVRNATSAAS